MYNDIIKNIKIRSSNVKYHHAFIKNVVHSYLYKYVYQQYA